jgi:hypothetical protein
MRDLLGLSEEEEVDADDGFSMKKAPATKSVKETAAVKPPSPEKKGKM